MKTCSKCGLERPVSDFRLRNKNNPARGLQAYCRPCEKVMSAAHYQANREHFLAKNRDHKLRRTYGISQADFDRMLHEQEGKCPICGTAEVEAWGNFHVDHDHATGAVRSLLCGNCNQGLGNFKDDADRLLAAAAYLLQHQEVTSNVR